MFLRFLTSIGIAGCVLVGVAFAQNPAPAPFNGYNDTFQVNYMSNMTVAGGFVNIVNAGAHGGSTAEGGDICVNVYTYDPDEQPRNCCTCRLSPNAVKSLTAADLSNPLFAGAQAGPPTSLTVKLLVTTVPANGCDAARTPTAIGTAGGYATGMRAWATHLHTAAAPLGLYGTESHFAEAPLSQGEQNKLIAVCTFIRAFASGNGICNACAVGARRPTLN